MEAGIMYQTFVYISAAVIAVPIAKRFGLGSVLGYLLAGILIGPFIFNFIEEGESIMHFAEFGVIMMMFLIGLELEPALLWKLKTPILGLGGLQVGFSSLAFAGIFISFTDLAWQTSLAIGLTLALSSTAIVLQTLEEKGLMKTIGGQNAFSVLLFQDIAVIPILALFPFLAVQDLSSIEIVHELSWIESLPIAIRSLITISAIIAIIIAGKYLMSPLFRYIAQTGILELFTATALLLIIGITLLMTQVGLSPALGTFLAGVVLAQSEYKHELETNIKPFKGLLLGLFFIAVGASIDFSLIAAEPIYIGSLVAMLISVKFIVLLGVGKLFGMRIDNNLSFSFALAQGGEFAFVLFSFSLQNGVMTPEITAPLTVAVAISMALTPLFMIINEKFIQSNTGVKQEEEKPKDNINTTHSLEEKPIIIAGFGRYGSTIGRFIQANHHQATYLDIDPNMVYMMRKMGLQVFYGDASRYDLLATAGAAKAKLLVIAVDNENKSIEIIETAKKHFPHLKIYARASSWANFQKMIQLKVDKVYRDHLETSMRIAEDSLSFLGKPKFQVHRASLKFKKHDDVSFNKLAEEELTQHEFALNRRQFIQELELIIKEDQENLEQNNDFDWDTGSVKKIMEPIIRERYKNKIK